MVGSIFAKLVRDVKLSSGCVRHAWRWHLRCSEATQVVQMSSFMAR